MHKVTLLHAWSPHFKPVSGWQPLADAVAGANLAPSRNRTSTQTASSEYPSLAEHRFPRLRSASPRENYPLNPAVLDALEALKE